MCLLAPANEKKNRTVLLLMNLGQLLNPPVEVRVIGDLFTIVRLESVCSEIINLNGITTTNVIPLTDGPSLKELTLI